GLEKDFLPVKPVIHKRSAPRKWSSGTQHSSIFKHIHLGMSFQDAPCNENPYAMGHSDPLISPGGFDCSDFL
ncbi:hypothetical protein AVEN_251273-1, partial [Araneus ventricosus]